MVMSSNNSANAKESANSANGVIEAQNSVEIYYNHPLFLHPSDVSGLQIIYFQLTRI